MDAKNTKHAHAQKQKHQVRRGTKDDLFWDVSQGDWLNVGYLGPREDYNYRNAQVSRVSDSTYLDFGRENRKREVWLRFPDGVVMQW